MSVSLEQGRKVGFRVGPKMVPHSSPLWMGFPMVWLLSWYSAPSLRSRICHIAYPYLAQNWNLSCSAICWDRLLSYIPKVFSIHKEHFMKTKVLKKINSWKITIFVYFFGQKGPTHPRMGSILMWCTLNESSTPGLTKNTFSSPEISILGCPEQNMWISFGEFFFKCVLQKTLLNKNWSQIPL